MSIQFLTHSSGKNTGVFIPIDQWKKLKSKFRDLENEEIDIPEWQKLKLDKRLEKYSANPEEVLNAEDALDDKDNEL